MPEELNRRLAEVFAERNLNPSSLAERAGVSRSTVHQWIKKPDKTVDPDTLRKVAEYLEWPVEEAFRWARLLPPRSAVDPLSDARQALLGLPARPAARTALIKLAEELSRSLDDDCRLRFQEAWGAVTGRYAAGDVWDVPTLLGTIRDELHYLMFEAPGRTTAPS
jgi:transcriptional regulator with XRE-family HTH domain